MKLIKPLTFGPKDCFFVALAQCGLMLGKAQIDQIQLSYNKFSSKNGIWPMLFKPAADMAGFKIQRTYELKSDTPQIINYVSRVTYGKPIGHSSALLNTTMFNYITTQRKFRQKQFINHKNKHKVFKKWNDDIFSIYTVELKG